jgi:phage terminase large subunit-like protein
MSNIVIDQDPAGNIKPAKNKCSEKIDPAVALIMAVGRAVTNTEDMPVIGSDYELLVC